MHIDWLSEKVLKGDVFQYIVNLNIDIGKHAQEKEIPVGCVYLQHYDAETNCMESGVFFDENAPKGQGLASEAVRLMNERIGFWILDFAPEVYGCRSGRRGGEVSDSIQYRYT